YAWEERHVADFWNDLTQLRPGNKHYTGVLTLEEVQASDWQRWEDDRWIIESKRYKPFFVVDGQQRLTTIVILIRRLLSSVGKDRVVNFTPCDKIRDKFIYESKDAGISRSFLFGYEKDN